MKYLCIAEEYDSGGEKKLSWKRIGELFDGKNGKQYVKLYHIPGALIHVFEKDKQSTQQDPNDNTNF